MPDRLDYVKEAMPFGKSNLSHLTSSLYFAVNKKIPVLCYSQFEELSSRTPEPVRSRLDAESRGFDNSGFLLEFIPHPMQSRNDNQ